MEEVGYTEDGKAPAEFNITSFLTKGKNTIALRVYRWSDASYMEDQDFWRLSEITRDTYLLARNKTHIQDYTVVSDLDETYTKGVFELRLKLENKNKKSTKVMVGAKLFKGNQEILSFEEKTKVKTKGALNFIGLVSDVSAWTAERHQTCMSCVST